MDRVRASHPRQKPQSTPKPEVRKTRKRGRVVSDSEDEREAKRMKAQDKTVRVAGPSEEGAEDDTESTAAFEQPALITGATLKDYQLEGVAWMAGLYQNGISGILGA